MQLPEKLSDLLDLAVADANKCAVDPRYLLNMNTWHAPKEKTPGVCEVCMAGAVLAQTLAFTPDRIVVPWDAEPGDDVLAVRAKLYAINEMRTGNFAGAERELPTIPLSEAQQSALADASSEIATYLPDDFDEEEDDLDDLISFVAPWHAYTKAAQILREAGL